jgi:predicted PurR-regulated permease PerM
MNAKSESPFYLRFSLTLLGLGLLALGVYLGRGILLPFLFSVMLATLLLPVVKFLQRKGIGKVPAISISLIISVVVIGSLIYFLSTQIGSFLDDIPALQKRFTQLLWSGQKWVKENMNIGIRQQNEYINEASEKMKDGSPEMVSKTVVTLTEIISYVVFLPIYAFLLLYHKDMIKRFLIEIFKDGEEGKVREVLQESQLIAQQYITGLLIESCIVFTLNSAGFLILGIKYPIFLALIAALLNIVPYIGMIIANIFCFAITIMSSSDPSLGLWVMVTLAAVQIVDNNILMPFIVGTKVKLNALVIILGVLVGGALSGFAGMFLAIPGLAVMKIICERVDNLKPWAILLGDETTAEEDKKNPIKRTINRVRERSQSRKALDKK